ncbi:MAG TPA: hypothetical protein PLD37_09330, partial [Usitatibacteraceae bacterium]|nr:hypothetical protein [Usitatibacteraceae bacterium]
MKRTALSLALLSALAVPAIAAEPDTEAVEFYHGGLNHYFITATASEAKLIDDGAAGAGWVRTGRSFRAWLDAAKAPANAAGVCRFYSRGANSHFYTASEAECEGLKSIESQERARLGAAFTGWQFEGIAFRIETAGAAGCESGTVPVTRVYNDGFVSGEGSNHRFVDDSDLRSLMLDRAWVGEGTAFCARGKATGTNANLPPTTSAFDSLAATWSGTAKWKKEIAGVETRVSAPVSLVIAADGTVSGSGRGCAFTGRVNAGDGFRSLFSGSLAASGCEDAAFNGDYRRFQLERYSGGTLRIKAKRGDGANEAEIEATLTAAGGTTAPPPSSAPSAGGISGEWNGTVGWTLLRRQGGNETVLVASNLPLSVTVGDG